MITNRHAWIANFGRGSRTDLLSMRDAREAPTLFGVAPKPFSGRQAVPDRLILGFHDRRALPISRVSRRLG